MPINFPKRKHIGCDPMCDDCQNWLHKVMEMTKPATAEAFKVFVNTIEAIIPEASNLEFEDYWDSYPNLEESVGLHIAECLPKPDAVYVNEADVKKKRFEPLSTEAQSDALWLPFK